MSGFGKALGAVGPVATLLDKLLTLIDKWTTKSPEEEIDEENEDRQKDAHEVGDAIKEARSGKTGKLEDIINSRD